MAAAKKAYILRLQQAGEMFVSLARNSGAYTDQTGNLRSSVGYIIGDNGRLIDDNFHASPKGDQFGKGIAEGRRLAIENISPKGLCLIGVAGMDYAAAVEARGKDVISGSSLQVEQWLKTALSNLNLKL